ncbi:MAG: hypothetical protein CME19_00435 [Gemmatimonadetes bacterium]|nr:hypothetical protein [Gemmatimonadota bacterium]
MPTADRGIAGVLLFLVLLGVGCATNPPLLPPPITDPADLIDRVTSQTDSLQDIRMRSRISFEIDGVRQKATSIVFAEMPSRLKMEVSGTLGISILSARFWGDSLRVYLPEDNGYLEGPAATVLYQITGMNLDFYDIQPIILGIPTLANEDRSYLTSFETTPTSYVLSFSFGVYRKRIWIDRRRLTVAREDIIGHDDELRSRLLLSDYAMTDGCHLPGEVRIEQGENKISWSVEELNINDGSNPDIFTLKMPPGVSRLGQDH